MEDTGKIPKGLIGIAGKAGVESHQTGLFKIILNKHSF
jgi:hypothetical protein